LVGRHGMGGSRVDEDDELCVRESIIDGRRGLMSSTTTWPCLFIMSCALPPCVSEEGRSGDGIVQQRYHLTR